MHRCAVARPARIANGIIACCAVMTANFNDRCLPRLAALLLKVGNLDRNAGAFGAGSLTCCGHENGNLKHDMTRRTAIILLFTGSFSRIQAEETNRIQGTLLFTNSPFNIETKWMFDFDLDRCTGLTVRKGGKSINITPEEIWKALQP